MSRYLVKILFVGLFLTPVTAVAHEANDEVVPEHEYATAAGKNLSGPAETRGVASVEKLGSLALIEEFPAMDGYEFRMREITIEPGGVIAVHEHDSRPGYAYILEGEIIEHRNDQPQPIIRSAGDVAMEKTGVAHWWENRSDEPVRALVIDIVPAQ